MNAVEIALQTKLAGESSITSLLADGASSIYNQQAERGASLPYVVYAYAGGGDENQTPRRLRNVLYQVRAVSDTSRRAAGAIDDAIDAILHNGSISPDGWTNFWLAREGDINFTETTGEGKEYFHRGGTYRLRISK